MSKILFVCSDSKESSMYWAIEKSKQTSTNSSRDTTKTPASPRETHILCYQSSTSTSSWLMLRVRGRLVSLGHWMSPSRPSKAACFYLARVYRSFRASAGFHTKSWLFMQNAYIWIPHMVLLFLLGKYLISLISASLAFASDSCVGVKYLLVEAQTIV